MSARSVEVIGSKRRTFKNERGDEVSYYQICASDDSRFYLLNSREDIKSGISLDIVYDNSRKRFCIINYR